MTQGNPNHPLLAKINPYASAEAVKSSWEHSRILHLLQVMQLTHLKPQIKNITATDLFTFDAFLQVCSAFPMHLFFDTLSDQIPIHRDNKSVHPMWFKSFTALPVIKKYTEKIKQCSWDFNCCPVGLVFPRKGFQQGLIVHNGSFEKYVPESSGCHIYKQEGGSTLIVQSFTGFLSNLKQRDEV
jgi:hypothetical protein